MRTHYAVRFVLLFAAAPPSIIEAAGVRQLVLLKPDSVYAVEPAAGKLLWETPYDADNGSIIMTPVRVGEHLFIGGYQGKNLLLRLRGDAPGVFTETGDLVIARLAPQGYEESSRAHLLEPTNVAFGRPVVWCPPAYANRAIVVRNDKEVIRVSLAD